MTIVLDNITPQQKKMLMIGVPVVGVAAIYSLAKGGGTPAEDDEVLDDAVGGSGTVVGVIPGGTPGGQSTGAIGTGELSSFLENVSDALAVYKAENAAAIDELRAESDDWRSELEDAMAARFDQENQTPVGGGLSPQPPATREPAVISTEQQVRDLFARRGVDTSYTHAPSTESPDARVARITREIESGQRTWADLDKSLGQLANKKAGG